MCALADLANAEFRTDRVPKSNMKRSSGLTDAEKEVLQFSTILGSVPPKPNFRRAYPTISSVHRKKSAHNFIKAMIYLAKESEKLIKEVMPEQHARQTELFEDVDDQWKFSPLFTSSISNFNISARFHVDHANIKGTVNVIICKKLNTVGGDLHLPDYNATIGQQDNSILVYPAWKSMHGVTEITETFEAGYRNSLIFYPLKAFHHPKKN